MLFIDKLVKAEQEALAQPGDPRRGVVAVLRAFEGTHRRLLAERLRDQVLNFGVDQIENVLKEAHDAVAAEAGR